MASSLSVLCFLVCLAMGKAWAGSHREQLSCHSWRFNVEVNNLQSWTVVPDKCEYYIAAYMTGPAYRHDSKGTTDAALTYARDFLDKDNLHLSKSTYCWVFDVDETSLSNLPYYKHHRFGAEAYNDTVFEKWVETARAPALRATLRLVHKLQELGYAIIFLTGRDESQRAVTASNLASAGYKGWKELLLRQKEDHGLDAIVYKSKKRKVLEGMGYTIVGNVGDQWSDLTGYSIGTRVFKLPNPMYYIS